MEIIILKANNDNYIDFKNFNTLEDLFNFKDEVDEDFIFGLNNSYNDDPNKISEEWEIDFEKAKKISKSKYNIMIYDDYVE